MHPTAQLTSKLINTKEIASRLQTRQFATATSQSLDFNLTDSLTETMEGLNIQEQTEHSTRNIDNVELEQQAQIQQPEQKLMAYQGQVKSNLHIEKGELRE
ncbi:15830_t:CDS:1, partial [Gigaspora rosea]